MKSSKFLKTRNPILYLDIYSCYCRCRSDLHFRAYKNKNELNINHSTLFPLSLSHRPYDIFMFLKLFFIARTFNNRLWSLNTYKQQENGDEENKMLFSLVIDSADNK